MLKFSEVTDTKFTLRLVFTTRIVDKVKQEEKSREGKYI